jgi:hypothetical protein
MLRVLLLLAFLLANALAAHEKAGAGATDLLPGLDPNGGHTAAPTTKLLAGLDPNGLQTAAPTTDQLPGLDPNGAK